METMMHNLNNHSYNVYENGSGSGSDQSSQNHFIGNLSPSEEYLYANSIQKRASMDAMREMIFRIAMMQPIHIDPVSVKPPRRKNVRISKDPQSVAARHRREKISEKIRILQRLVPGGTKMDTASMLDEAAHYLKFLKKQVQTLEQTTPSSSSSVNEIPAGSGQAKSCQNQHAHMVGSMQMLSFGS